MAYFSIIIPVYNAGKTITACLDSIFEQDFRDFEVVCVDDCSKDDSTEIIKRYAASLNGKDADKLRLIENKKNLGAMTARKIGFAASSGEYIWYIDPDDGAAGRTALSAIYAELKRKPADMLQIDTEVIITDKAVEGQKNGLLDFVRPYAKELKGRQIFTEAALNRKITHNVWNKICTRGLWEKVYRHVPDVNLCMSEDLCVMFIAFYYAESFRGTSKVKAYRYNFGGGISVSNDMTLEKFEKYSRQAGVFTVLEKFIEDTGDESIELKEACSSFKNEMLKNCVYLWHEAVSVSESRTAFEMLVRDWGFMPVWKLITADYFDDRVGIIDRLYQYRFETDTRPVKTIGIYYHRMYNGGIERVISLVIPMWLKLGYRIVLLTDEQENEKDFPIPDCVERYVVQPCDRTDRSSYENRGYHFRHAIEKYGIDTVVYHAWNNMLLFWDLMSVKAAGARFVVQTHLVFNSAISWYRGSYLSLCRTLGMADRVVSITSADRCYWLNYNRRTVYIPNPIDPALTAVRPSAYGGHNIVWVARFEDYKRPKDAFAIMKIVKERVSDAKLIMVGTTEKPEAMKPYEELRRELGLEDNIEFAGYHTNVEHYYENAAVYLHTSELEGFSMVLLEAKAHGLPVVMYNLKYLDMVREHSGMNTLETGDINGAAKSVIRLLEDEEYRRAQAKASRESFDRMAAVDISAKWKEFFDGFAQMPETGDDFDAMSREIVVDLLNEAYIADMINHCSDPQAFDRYEELRQAQLVCGQVINSASFKIGRVITWLPRKLRDLLKGKSEE